MEDKNIRLLIEKIAQITNNIKKEKINIMEVCGTHTHTIYEYGIKEMLPAKVKLISGPGCPVCVTNQDFIDEAISFGKQGATIITFGDIVKVKGSNSSLLEEASKGVELKIVYSLEDVIEICKNNPLKAHVLLGVGFETTAPLVGAIIKEARRGDVKNLFLHSAIKIMPPIIKKIVNSTSPIDGFILPGHVAVILGEKEFGNVLLNSKKPSVIAGFTLMDILVSIYLILKEINNIEKGIEYKEVSNLYKNYVTLNGNVKAKAIMDEVFTIESGQWRGIGTLSNSVLQLKNEYRAFNPYNKFKISIENNKANFLDILGCKCSEVIMGKLAPNQCTLFKEICNSENPLGPCMVSIEGACYSAYKFNN